MILLLHNRYRVRGGEERAVEDLAWLIRASSARTVEVLERDSAARRRARRGRRAARGGLRPGEVGDAVRRSGARVVHAHNVHPTLGWRALAAARAAGARVVLHLHNYRLVCAVGTCFTRGEDCTRCHGRDTRPGVRAELPRLAGRGGRLRRRRWRCGSGGSTDAADAFVVPSAFALGRLRALGAPLGDRARVVPLGAARRSRERSTAAAGALRARGRPAGAREGRRRRDRRLPARRRCRSWSRATGRRRTSCARSRAGADVRFTGPGRAGRAGASCARRRARGRRPVALRGDPAARRARGGGGGAPGRGGGAGGLREAVPPRACIRRATSPRWPSAIGALWGDAAAGERALAAARERTRPPRSPRGCGSRSTTRRLELLDGVELEPAGRRRAGRAGARRCARRPRGRRPGAR